MINRLLQAIIGSTAEGQRKMAMGVYTIGLLFLVAASSTVGTWAGPEKHAALLQGIATHTVTAIGAAFGLLIVGNVGEHAFKAKGQ